MGDETPPPQDFSDRFPSDPEPISTPPKSNIGLWVGLGCLGVVILSCCLLSYWAQTYGLRWILSRSDETKSWASRVIIAGALEGARASCSDGAVSEDSLPWFHPKVAADVRNLACELDRASIQQLSTPDEVAGERLDEIGQEQITEPFGLDPALCYRYATDSFTVVGCFDPEPESGSIPYKIIDLGLAEP